MPAPLATENWSDRSFVRDVSAHRGWMVTGATDELNAIGIAGANEASSHPQDGRMTIPKGGVVVKRLGGVGVYDVQADYTIDPAKTTGDSELAELAEILPDFNVSSEPIDTDIHGNAIVNSARMPFAQPVMDDFTAMTLTITQWESTLDMQKLLAYTYPRPALNSGPIFVPRVGTFLAGQLKLKAVRIANGFKPDAGALRITYYCEARGYYELKNGLKINGFAKRILDQGRRALMTKNGTITTGAVIPKAGGDPVSDDVLLDGSGQPLFVNGSVAYDVQDASSSPPTIGNKATLPMPQTVGVDQTEEGTFLYYTTNPNLPFQALGWKFS